LRRVAAVATAFMRQLGSVRARAGGAVANDILLPPFGQSVAPKHRRGGARSSRGGMVAGRGGCLAPARP